MGSEKDRREKVKKSKGFGFSGFETQFYSVLNFLKSDFVFEHFKSKF